MEIFETVESKCVSLIVEPIIRLMSCFFSVYNTFLKKNMYILKGKEEVDHTRGKYALCNFCAKFFPECVRTCQEPVMKPKEGQTE